MLSFAGISKSSASPPCSGAPSTFTLNGESVPRLTNTRGKRIALSLRLYTAKESVLLGTLQMTVSKATVSVLKAKRSEGDTVNSSSPMHAESATTMTPSNQLMLRIKKDDIGRRDNRDI